MICVTPEDNLQAVFDAAPAGETVHLEPGVYRQKLMLRTPGLTLEGSSAAETVIVWDDHARKPHPVGWEYNTFRTYTLAVCADGVTMRNLTVANDAGCPREKGQEVALSVVADDFRMENCRLFSTQDTLFAGPLPADLIGRYEGFLLDPLRRGGKLHQVFDGCLIEGSVDFIFGSGVAEFESCEIRSVFDDGRIGFVAAPSHGLHQQEGFCFRNCCFTAEEKVVPGSVYLARPWRDHGIAAFENCTYGSHIAPEGFDKWNDTDRDKTARFYETPEIAGRVVWANRNKEAR
ncbi:MAG: pectin esterase [Oscillospiraceae bacterium]|nr:pectin esterase [Oscillospiraceae bacterium]